MTKQATKTKKRVGNTHRHKWMGGYDNCWNCGFPEPEFCEVEGCYAVRYKDSNGKAVID